MDPNANLEELREVANWLRANEDNLRADDAGDAALVIEKAARAAELLEALDAWICRGGALPRRWTRPPA
jgi:hypothetical protein